MSNRAELPENIFSTDEFFNSDGGDVFVGYGSVTDDKSPPIIEDFFQLPRSEYDIDDDVTQEPIEIPQPVKSRILLDVSDSGSDSGISGEHPQTIRIEYDVANSAGTNLQRTTSSPSRTSLPTYVISKQPTSTGRMQSQRSNVHMIRSSNLNNGVIITNPQSLPVDQYMKYDSSMIVDHGQTSIDSNNEPETVTGLVLASGDVVIESSSLSLSGDESAGKEEPLNPKMHSILQSKVRIQPRPNLESVVSTAVVANGDSNYTPVTKRARSSIKTVVPTMMTGEDTAEIVYTPQTTYVLNNPGDTITLPPSLQVKAEPFIPTPCTIERPGLSNQTSIDASESPKKSGNVFFSMLSNGSDTAEYGLSDEQFAQQNLSTLDIVERSRLAKKQERMIKNRQAASLSRQRKKEYLETLEGTLDALRRENRELRRSNEDIQRRYEDLTRKLELLEKQSQNTMIFTPSSSANNSFDSVSSFLSSSSEPPLAVQPVVEESNHIAFTHSVPSVSSMPCTITRSVNGLSTLTPVSTQHAVQTIRYSPQLRRKVPIVGATLAASSALAFFCLLVLNLNSTLSLTSPVSYSSSYWKSRRGHSHESAYSSGFSSSLPDSNGIGVFNLRAHSSKTPSRTLFSVPFGVNPGNDPAGQRSSQHPQCPVVSFNSTESIRVASELNQWAAQYKKEAKLAFLRNLWYMKTTQKMNRRQRESNIRRMNIRNGGRINRYDSNAVQIHRTGDPRMDQLMFGFRRRNDTMYFVSLTGDHLLFPAINTSKSRLSRPKVSFIMPAVFGLNDTVRPGRDQIAMMQIDSEVVNYSVFHLDKRHLSSYFKVNKNGRPSHSWDQF